MKRLFIITILVFILGGVFSVNAQDWIILKNGNVIEAQVTEISPSEIRYKRFYHLDGPVIVILKNDVLSIRYGNGTVEIFNNVPTGSLQTGVQSQSFQNNENNSASQPGIPVILQPILNSLPAIRIAGNSLKFEFSGESWFAKVNGRNFLEGTVTSQNTDEGSILTLKQTHTYVAGRRVNTPGADIILEYKKGPPASLRQISRPQDTPAVEPSTSQRTNSQSSNTQRSNTQTTAEPESNTQTLLENNNNLLMIPSDFIGTWKRHNFDNTLTFTENGIQSSSSRIFARLNRVSGDAFTFRDNNSIRTFTYTIRLIDDNIEIRGGIGRGQGNWNGIWMRYN